jgi:hypothetical protein
MYESVKKAFEEKKATNSKVLVLEQINAEIRQKEMDTNQIYID